MGHTIIFRDCDLVSCPFCGEKEDLEEYTFFVGTDPNEDGWTGDKAVRCQNCGAIGPPCSTWTKAQDSWQHRVIHTIKEETDNLGMPERWTKELLANGWKKISTIMWKSPTDGKFYRGPYQAWKLMKAYKARQELLDIQQADTI